jgi:hypothetical protein
MRDLVSSVFLARLEKNPDAERCIPMKKIASYKRKLLERCIKNDIWVSMPTSRSYAEQFFTENSDSFTLIKDKNGEEAISLNENITIESLRNVKAMFPDCIIPLMQDKKLTKLVVN